MKKFMDIFCNLTIQRQSCSSLKLDRIATFVMITANHTSDCNSFEFNILSLASSIQVSKHKILLSDYVKEVVIC